MIKKKESVISKKLIFFVFFISLLLYVAGVFSGLYANKIVEAKTKEDIFNLKYETKQEITQIENKTSEELDYMKKYIEILEINLKSLQFDQEFVDSLSHDEMCYFSNITLSSLLRQLDFYWTKLPLRLEEYEKSQSISEEYLQLKKQYIPLSIRTWIYAKNKYDKCNTSLIPVLYFYSKDCEYCILQGEQLDELRNRDVLSFKKVIVFTVDINSDDLMVDYLKKYYNVNNTPAIIISDHVFSGRLFLVDEIIEGMGWQQKNK